MLNSDNNVELLHFCWLLGTLHGISVSEGVTYRFLLRGERFIVRRQSEVKEKKR